MYKKYCSFSKMTDRGYQEVLAMGDKSLFDYLIKTERMIQKLNPNNSFVEVNLALKNWMKTLMDQVDYYNLEKQIYNIRIVDQGYIFKVIVYPCGSNPFRTIYCQIIKE